MPAYRYRAVHASGRIAQGRVAAANEWELAQHLNSSGLELIEARARPEPPQQRPRLHRRLPPRTLTRFAAQMTDLLRAGISLPETLRDVGEAAETGALRDALDDIGRAVDHGSGVAAAFARHPRLFPGIFTSILAAGEKSGDLAATFAHLARYAADRARIIEQQRRALRYPLFLLAVALGVVTFMMTMVVPPIIQFLDSIGGELPLATRILVAVASLFTGYWWIAALALPLAAILLPVLRRLSEQTACTIDGLMLRLPALGPLMRKMALARFARSFAILFQSGLGIPESLASAGGTLGNAALEAALDRAGRRVQSGQALSSAMAELFPSFAQRMMRIGERSGKLGKTLDDIADVYDRDATEASERLIGALEPALTILIGAILAWVVLAVLGPIYGNLARLGGMM